MASPSDLPPGWTAATAPSGQMYYTNHVTKTTQWERPVAPAAAAQPVGSDGAQQLLKKTGAMMRGLKKEFKVVKEQVKAHVEEEIKKAQNGAPHQAGGPAGSPPGPAGKPSATSVPTGGHSSADTGGDAAAAAADLRATQIRCEKIMKDHQRRLRTHHQLGTGIHYGPGWRVTYDEGPTGGFNY